MTELLLPAQNVETFSSNWYLTTFLLWSTIYVIPSHAHTTISSSPLPWNVTWVYEWGCTNNHMRYDVRPLLHCVLTVTSTFPIANRLWSTWSSHCFLSSFNILIDPGQEESEERQREVTEPPTVALIAPTINTIQLTTQLTTLRTNLYSSTSLVPRLLCVGMRAWERGYSSTYRQGCKVQPHCYGNLDSLLLGETRQNLIGYC